MKTPQFDNSFSRLPSFFHEKVKPTPIKNARLIHVTGLKDTLGLSALSDEELKLWLNGELELPGEQRIATRYAGHQFGVWAGQLGDGRAISLGEILTRDQERLEIQTKGSGLTPFSRMGDGKAVLRSSVREYLCSEAMAGLGIPTTGVLALLSGEDRVFREQIERSALVARVFPSNLRFGHFEMAHHFDEQKAFKALTDYTRMTFFQGKPLEEMLEEIVQRTASLMAQWMGVGFCHGVMNTDNMSVLGLTIDYGPFGFLEDTSLNYVCNHSDHRGRYAYGQQPSVGLWNLERFLVCFVGEVPKERLEKILSGYQSAFERGFMGIGREKLGLKNHKAHDHKLFAELLQVMDKLSFDFTFTFRSLCGYRRGQEAALTEIWDYYGAREEFKSWLKQYDERLGEESLSDEERAFLMRQVNPKYVLKNYIAQEVIDEVENSGPGRLAQWLGVLSAPFDEHPDFEQYALPTPPEHKNYVVSCSS